MYSKKPITLEKTGKRHLSLILALCLVCNVALTQAKSGFENYNYLSKTEKYLWMPVLHYQSGKGLYAELRYNYEAERTVSVFGGNSFSGGNKVVFNVTPMVGFSSGEFTGFSLATKAEAEWQNVFASTEMQYSMDVTNREHGFYYSWSELGYSLFKNFFAGVSVQQTLQAGFSETEPGFLAGFNAGNFTMPVYLFNPFESAPYFVLGINYESQVKKKKKVFITKK
jgi:hypothetical protein